MTIHPCPPRFFSSPIPLHLPSPPSCSKFAAWPH
jgi:hypothetical protein